MECVTTARFSISINGELVGYFQSGRVLRQGDPMSPTPFVLAMEIFSCLMKQACVGTKFKYHWRCKNEEISHLCFADDLMVFSNGDLESIAIINNVLHIFQHLSGLTPQSG